MLDRLTSQTSYKLIAATGVVLVVAAPWSGWRMIAGQESYAESLYEHRILTRLDLESLREQQNNLQLMLTDRSDELPVDSEAEETGENAPYTEQQKRQLAGEAGATREQIDHLNQQQTSIDEAIGGLLRKLRLTFIGSVVATGLGLLLLCVGVLGWSFHVRILEDRRSQPRGND